MNIDYASDYSKKDKISHCTTIADSLGSQNVSKSNQDFAKYLSMAMEVFFTLCDDPDADVRLTADENLNRVIRTLSENHIGRLQVGDYCLKGQTYLRLDYHDFKVEGSHSESDQEVLLPCNETLSTKYSGDRSSHCSMSNSSLNRNINSVPIFSPHNLSST